MALFKRKTPVEETLSVQTGRTGGHPFAALGGYVPLHDGDTRLFEAMREAVPVIDAAISKTVRLCGGFTTHCADPHAEQALNDFLQQVPVGASGRGINSFVAGYLEQLLVYGTAVGEIVPTKSGRDIHALYNAPLQDLELKVGDNPLDVTICSRQSGETVPAPRQTLLLLSALSPQPGQVRGVSVLKGLPFMVDILLKIYHTIGVNFERVGNVRFAVTYKPGGEQSDRAFAKERAAQIAGEWQRAMRSDSVSDFVAVGDVGIQVIGADNQVLDMGVPARLILEQIVAKMGIPPFMLGLSWSSTERMSSQQADMLTSELEYYRGILTPVILRIARLWLALHGYGCGVEIAWNHISLQDEVELAKSRLLDMQARQIEEKLANGKQGKNR